MTTYSGLNGGKLIKAEFGDWGDYEGYKTGKNVEYTVVGTLDAKSAINKLEKAVFRIQDAELVYHGGSTNCNATTYYYLQQLDGIDFSKVNKENISPGWEVRIFPE